MSLLYHQLKHRAQNVSDKDIPVVILCGGRGTRLKEETEIIPKPLVTIGGRPILWHIMKIYYAFGHKNFIIAGGYKSEKIKEYFLNYAVFQSDFTIDFNIGGRITMHTPPQEDWKITVVDTGQDTLTGARIKRIAPYIKGNMFLLTYGDGLANINIKKLINFHKKQNTIATVTGVHPPARFGEIILDRSMATHFFEKPQVRHDYINGGFFVFDRKIFQYINDDPSLSLEKDILPVLTQSRLLSVHRHDGYWQCMDTIRDMEVLQGQWSDSKPPWKIWNS